MSPSTKEQDEEDERRKDEEDSSSTKRHWMKVVQQWLQRQLSAGTTRAAIVSLTSIVVLTILWNRRKRRQLGHMKKQHNTSSSNVTSATATSVPLSILLAAIDQGRLRKALLGTSRILFQTNETDTSGVGVANTWQQTVLPSNETLKKHIVSTLTETAKQNHSTELGVLSETDYGALATTLLATLPFVYLALVYHMMREQQSHSVDGTSHKRQLSAAGTKTFADVAGLDSAILELSEIVDYMQHPRRYRAYGASAPRGVLLSGPPGTGKTLLAQAVHGEVAQQCRHCVFIACSASDFVELYVGRGAARVRALFQSARAQAQRARGPSTPLEWIATLLRTSRSSRVDPNGTNGPPCAAIIFIDELDALAKTRSHGVGHSNDEREQTLNQLLIEMDGFNEDDVTIVVLAATNRADVLDPAIVRRFDRHVSVGYPNSVAARRAILRVHAQTIVTAPSSPMRPGVIAEIEDDMDDDDSDTAIDWTRLASDELTGNMSGSDLRNLINEAALLAVRQRRHGAQPQPQGVTQRHLEEAALKIRRTQPHAALHALSPPRGFPRSTIWG